MARNPERERLLAEVQAKAMEHGLLWMREVMARTGAGRLRELTTRELRIIAAD